MWSLLGLALAIVLSVTAWRRSVAPAGYYDGQVYGMTHATHRRYAMVASIFVAVFAIAALFRMEFAAIVALAICTPVVIFYASSFLRGADDE